MTQRMWWRFARDQATAGGDASPVGYTNAEVGNSGEIWLLSQRRKTQDPQRKGLSHWIMVESASLTCRQVDYTSIYTIIISSMTCYSNRRDGSTQPCCTTVSCAWHKLRLKLCTHRTSKASSICAKQYDSIIQPRCSRFWERGKCWW